MQNRIQLIIVLTCVLASAIVSSMDISYTTKTIVYSISIAVLLIIGLRGIIQFWKEK
ncbi:hypothetical protein [Ornithinibacillus halophilus]|uniref:Uncharacterized protein n=1 Tax=Ornithinibacillus halophilus TaxID=930117 RepID=A0A1M5JWU5_9BACI|nr:hypothetical protein [Ornithinibacillus halophilus]SHG45014.1 hypothetical protein SAMN05216225_10346 [Ornithinibacillus halophilus]